MYPKSFLSNFWGALQISGVNSLNGGSCIKKMDYLTINIGDIGVREKKDNIFVTR